MFCWSREAVTSDQQTDLRYRRTLHISAFSSLFCYCGWSQIVPVIWATYLLFLARYQVQITEARCSWVNHATLAEHFYGLSAIAGLCYLSSLVKTYCGKQQTLGLIKNFKLKYTDDRQLERQIEKKRSR